MTRRRTSRRSCGCIAIMACGRDGEMTRIWFGKDVPKNGKERWSVTTAMHVDEERQVVSLARNSAADRSGALSHRRPRAGIPGLPCQSSEDRIRTVSSGKPSVRSSNSLVPAAGWAWRSASPAPARPPSCRRSCRPCAMMGARSTALLGAGNRLWHCVIAG